MAKILILHGPNLNLLGKREPQIYGSASLDDINQMIAEEARQYGKEKGIEVQLTTFQSNSESALVEAIQKAGEDGAKFIVINAAAFTHTSIAIRDALKFAGLPFIEVHISNVFAREEFRHKSYLADLAVGVIGGCGPNSYVFALRQGINIISKSEDV